jgi:hypothetical protein
MTPSPPPPPAPGPPRKVSLSCKLLLATLVLVLVPLSLETLLVWEQLRSVAGDSATVSERAANYLYEEENSMCCPKVYLYDPKDILKRIRALTKTHLNLTDLDPLNTDAVMYHHFNNTPVPQHSRIPLLTDVTRWLPRIPNRPLTRMDRLFDNILDPSAMLFYSKDYVHAFHLRLAVSGCVISDPADAELFIIPMSIHTDHPYGKMKGFQEKWNDLFSKITDFQQIFHHYTASTASKHVIFSSSFGHSRHSVGLWSPPYRDPYVHLLQRVALGSDELIRRSYGKWLKHIMQPPDSVVSAPFSTLLTYPQEMFNISAEKTVLVTSFFEMHGSAKKLRMRLDAICESSTDCWTKKKLLSMLNVTRSKKQLVGSFIEAKIKSTFCFEPEGDWPTRQSMVQDVLLTCIPVFFTSSYKLLWKSFWGNFIVDASVEFDGEAVLKGEVNVMESLRAISSDVILKKQNLLRRHRQQLLYLHMDQYILNGHNFERQCTVDAANILLRELLVRSKTLIK